MERHKTDHIPPGNPCGAVKSCNGCHITPDIARELYKLSAGRKVFAAGGAVRDILLSRPILDIDLVLAENAPETARDFAAATGGTLIPLDESHGISRVVSGHTVIDFSMFRQGACSIQEDLKLRDITINAMALPLEQMLNFTCTALPSDPAEVHRHIIDPCRGIRDIRQHTVRAISEHNLAADPLRLVRIFRFMSELDFDIARETLAQVEKLAPKVSASAPERTTCELSRILHTPRAGKTFKVMHMTGLLQEILPELKGMEGVEQPGFHHLDVLEHCFETLNCMDALAENPGLKFPRPTPFTEWLAANPDLVIPLKWAAFMHDWGKPSRKGVRHGRVTFYNHDAAGAEMAIEVARRLRWKIRHRDFTQMIVKLHMRPFHLLGDFRAGGPSRRAMRRLLEKTGTHYPALFLQAMADSMAGCGPLKPEGLDQELAGLASRIHEFHRKQMEPVKAAPRLLSGNEIMDYFNLPPSPLVGKILRAIETARIEGTVTNREQALKLARTALDESA